MFGKLFSSKNFILLIGGILIGGLVVGIYFFIVKTEDGKKNKNVNGEEVYTELNKKNILTSILFGGNKVQIDYSKSRKNGVAARFFMEPGENWQGSGFWDRGTNYEGATSLGIISRAHDTSLAFYDFNDKIDFAKVKFIDFYLKISDLSALENFQIRLSGKNADDFYYYDVTNTQKEWNFLRIPVEQFSRQGDNSAFNLSAVSRLGFKIISRPNNVALVNIDQLIIENDSSFLNDWNTVKSEQLSLDKRNDQTHLMLRSLTANDIVTLSSLPGVKDFTYSLKLSPQTVSRMGLFFRGDFKTGAGYYFLLDGKDTNSWQLKKMSQEKANWIDIAKGEIANNTFKNDKFYWLKVDANKDDITLFLSLDGKKYEPLYNFKDDEYLKGGIGAVIWDKGYGLFDEFNYESK
jgi:hypothetical protein